LLDFLRLQLPKPSAVPLWKVIVGPRADELQPGPARVRFLFAPSAQSEARFDWIGDRALLALAPGPKLA